VKTFYQKSGVVPTLLLTLIFAVTISGCDTAKDNPFELTISSGKLQGKAHTPSNDVAAFIGIPYAQPPVGAQRWAAPQTAKNWAGTLNADSQPPACPQQIIPAGNSAYSALSQSEDCLYLNVYAPTDALNHDIKTPLPVLVMIHGGGRARSATSRIRADIAALNRQGIVVVTPQYRLGIFSFFAHPELSAESPHGTSGNYGMQDLVEALKWVQTNIADFGGDPASVTIVGPSGGGTATGILLATPLSKGLFHRAAPLCSNAGIARMHYLKQRHLDQASAESLGVRFANSLNAESLAELRAIPANQILQHVTDSGIASYDPPSGAGDIVDGWMFPQPIINLHRTGARNDVPVLLGFNANELSVFARAGLIDDVPASPAAYKEFIDTQYGELSDDFLTQYPADSPIDSVYHAARDRVVSYGSETVARFSHKVTSPTYLYYMAHRPPDADQPVNGVARNKGVAHCTDDKYFFNWYPKQGASDMDHKMAKTMSEYMINFIKTGNPNPVGLTTWQPYALSGKHYMRFEAGEAQLSNNLLPGMWELHNRIRLHNNEQGRFRHWLGGWASNDVLLRNRLESD